MPKQEQGNSPEHRMTYRMRERTWRRLRAEAGRRNVSVQKLIDLYIEERVKGLPDPE